LLDTLSGFFVVSLSLLSFAFAVSFGLASPSFFAVSAGFGASFALSAYGASF
jgi:hypothetical protein